MNSNALVSAVNTNNIKEVERLLNAGVNPNLPNNVNIYPLSVAITRRYKHIFVLLINHPLINLTINEGREPYLHQATSMRDKYFIESLLNKGVDINCKNSSGSTCLHYSVVSRDIDMVKLLLNYGINKTIKNNDGNTAGELAGLMRCDNIAIYIKDFGLIDIKEPEFM